VVNVKTACEAENVDQFLCVGLMARMNVRAPECLTFSVFGRTAVVWVSGRESDDATRLQWVTGMAR
jgi:hypothetical protein